MLRRSRLQVPFLRSLLRGFSTPIRNDSLYSSSNTMLVSVPFSSHTYIPSIHSFSPPLVNRSFCSSGDSSSRIVIIKSEEEFNGSLTKVKGGELAAVFYFTAAWCGPCKFISPVIEELSKKYPDVSIFKIDVDEEGLARTLSKLQISSVPTLHFFQNGEKSSEIVGADVTKLRSTMAQLYK